MALTQQPDFVHVMWSSLMLEFLCGSVGILTSAFGTRNNVGPARKRRPLTHLDASAVPHVVAILRLCLICSCGSGMNFVLVWRWPLELMEADYSIWWTELTKVRALTTSQSLSCLSISSHSRLLLSVSLWGNDGRLILHLVPRSRQLIAVMIACSVKVNVLGFFERLSGTSHAHSKFSNTDLGRSLLRVCRLF